MEANTAADPELSHGIFGDFEISRRQDGSLWELGRGAMGITYRAVDNVLKRTVALKVIETRPGADGAREIRERFLREARVAAGLRHPTVAEVFRFEALPEVDRCYYAMELVAGETLEARVRRDGPLEVTIALEIAIQVTRALVAAAEQGLIHRDLKPANIMVSDSDGPLQVKVIDFGLAKAVNKESLEMESTHGGFVGTPTFASPEQFRGMSADARSDIYSLGVTLWYALTGEVPHPGKTIEEIRRSHETAELPAQHLLARNVPPPLVALLRRILSPDPVARPQSAKILLEVLESCQAKVGSEPRRRARLIGSAVALAVVVLAAVVALQPTKAPQKVPPAPASDEAVLEGQASSSNAEAYEEYLRGIAQESRDTSSTESLEEMLRAFESAVRLDPSFAQAWARLSKTHSLYYWFYGDHSEGRIDKARNALAMATKLRPELSETYLARGYFHYWCERNDAAALQDFSEALRRSPRNADALRALGILERRHGKWKEAADHFERAAQLDPLNVLGLEYLGTVLEALQRFADERVILNRMIAISPKEPTWILWKARTYQLEGDLQSAAALVDSVMPKGAECKLGWMARSVWLYERKFKRVIESCAAEFQASNLEEDGNYVLNIQLAQAQKWSGDESGARISFLKSKKFHEEGLAKESNPPRIDVARLGAVCAGLGEPIAAIREGERAVALAKDDVFDGPALQVNLAQIHAQLGNADAAIAELPRLLQTPGSGLTTAALKLDPIWDPIRGDPRFQFLLANMPTDDAARISPVQPPSKR